MAWTSLLQLDVFSLKRVSLPQLAPDAFSWYVKVPCLQPKKAIRLPGRSPEGCRKLPGRLRAILWSRQGRFLALLCVHSSCELPAGTHSISTQPDFFQSVMVVSPVPSTTEGPQPTKVTFSCVPFLFTQPGNTTNWSKSRSPGRFRKVPGRVAGRAIIKLTSVVRNK